MKQTFLTFLPADVVDLLSYVAWKMLEYCVCDDHVRDES